MRAARDARLHVRVTAAQHAEVAADVSGFIAAVMNSV